MATMEPTINNALADMLRQTRRSWNAAEIVTSENTGMLHGEAGRPDILVREPNVSPVVVETEVLPASTVELDATSRLGKRVRDTGRTILSVIAVRLPTTLRLRQGSPALQAALAAADDLEMALFTGTDVVQASRWPRVGWLRGGVADLSILVQSASVPPEVIAEAANVLVTGVDQAAGLLDEVATARPGATQRIAESLHQEDGPQTRRLAMTILANAFVFQENLAGGPGGLASIRSIDELRVGSAEPSKAVILTEWARILEVNYWPIFDIARRILEIIPTAESVPIIGRIAMTAAALVESRLMRSHDLTGAVFQRLIGDRKLLAAFYTTPPAAALLAGLAIPAERFLREDGSWSGADDLARLRVADFACGTGTLLSTAYQRLGQLHELAGGDAEAIHPAMMAQGLIGCDVLPAATHLTASMLSGAHPTVKYDQSCILTVAYGRQPDGKILLGSLNLLDPQARLAFDAITARAVQGMGEAETEIWASLPHASFDLVIMNPPFTRPTGHEANKVGVPNPMFAAFGSTEEEQRLMGSAAARLAQGTCYHGNAGEASLFLALGERKLKTGGVLALVMPLSLLAGDAWEKSRGLLATGYADLIAVSIAGARDLDASFSADTGSAECLVVARKAPRRPTRVRRRRSSTPARRATFVILRERPQYPMVGAEIARQIRRVVDAGNLRRLEDGPLGGMPLLFGDDMVGQAVDAPLPAEGGWFLSRILDVSVAQAAYQITAESRIWLPTMDESGAVRQPMTTVAEIGKVGPYHSDISGLTQTGAVRGPFEIAAARPGTTPTYPALWSHDAARERTMRFETESEGLPRRGKTADEKAAVAAKVQSIWASASHCHLNRDFRFNSQSTGLQFTPRKTLGGRAWVSILLGAPELEKALTLWGNTTFGLLMYWWHANKQQAGRGSIGVKAADAMPVLNVTKLPANRLARAVEIFEAMADKELLPFNEIDADPVRREIDVLFGRDVLHLDDSILAEDGPLDILRIKLAQEPSIHGGKKSRVGES